VVAEFKTNGDNLRNVNHETTRNFRNKIKERLKEKINEYEINSKNNFRDS
jgi:hypothetical protein